MKKPRMLIVCGQYPYPKIKGGIENRIRAYRDFILKDDYEVFFYFYHPPMIPKLKFPNGTEVTAPTEQQLKAIKPFITFFMNDDVSFNKVPILKHFKETSRSLLMTQKWRVAGSGDYDAVITNYADVPTEDSVLQIGGFYDDKIYFKDRKPERYVLHVGRIHGTKNQVELVKSYKKEIYLKHKIPLYMVGGTFTNDYFQEVYKHVDGTAIIGTCQPNVPYNDRNWINNSALARIYNSARLFVLPSKQETFGLALAEAMACGCTCVVDGEYPGMPQDELKDYVVGNVHEYTGSIIENIDKALTEDIRLDGSEWIKQFSLPEQKKKIVKFIKTRIG